VRRAGTEAPGAVSGRAEAAAAHAQPRHPGRLGASTDEDEPGLSADKAAWLAAHWSKRGDNGRWHILGDAAYKIFNPVLTRAEDVIAVRGRIAAPLLWVEGEGKEFEGWYGGRYMRVQFE